MTVSPTAGFAKSRSDCFPECGGGVWKRRTRHGRRKTTVVLAGDDGARQVDMMTARSNFAVAG